VHTHTHTHTGPSPPTARVCRSRPIKIGRTLGFAECEVYDAAGVLTATGRHTKFLQMGAVWDFLFRDPAFSTTVRLVDKYAGLVRAATELKYHSKEELARLIALVKDSATLQGDEFVASFRCEPDHYNQVNSMHGGCQAIVLERAARDAMALTAAPVADLRAMTMTYLVGGKGEMSVHARQQSASPSGLVMRASLRRKAELLSEALLHWEA
jgi:acyl-coenzyme A thioesterase PaaI-like protein